MPEVSYRIGSLVFYIFCERGAPHHNKHVFVKYGSYEANFDIETGKKINGDLPARELRIVREILSKEYNVKEFLARWDFLNQENVPGKIDKFIIQR